MAVIPPPDLTVESLLMPGDLILVLNCGSSSIKFALFDACAEGLTRRPLWNGKVQGIGGPAPDFGETSVPVRRVELAAENPYTAALQLIPEQVAQRLEGRRIFAVGHLVVHGGKRDFAPTQAIGRRVVWDKS